ncbi:MAG: AmmeMemoRadiSam system protein A, partial [Anaerolineaceae bacterium]|nr:AmmeMemoRadiSam system protein A [Anaerolineaceae bacterium]
AVMASTQDTRFSPVKYSELKDISVEVSILTLPQELKYSSPDDLLNKLQPLKHGVIIQTMYGSSTFLPQVWDALPQPEVFLGHLCNKMGAPTDHWKRKKLEVLVYQVEEFQE